MQNPKRTSIIREIIKLTLVSIKEIYHILSY